MKANTLPNQSVKLTYKRNVLYSENCRNFVENLSAARKALATILDLPEDELDAYILCNKEYYGDVKVEGYRSY